MESRKKVGFIAGAGLGAAAAVALRRRWAGDEEAPTATPSPTPIGNPQDLGVSFLANLRAAVQIPTVSYEDTSLIDFGRFVEFRAFLSKTYPLTHRLEHELVAEHSLLFTWPGSDPDAPPLLLMAHQDVVPVETGTEDDWEKPPFSGEEDDWYLYGRGTLDDKGSLIAILEAVESLLAEEFVPPTTVYLAFGHDEETGGSGAAMIASVMAERGIRCSLALDEGGGVGVDFLPGIDVPVALIGIGEKGYVNVRLSATGSGGHSSAPPAHTAIGSLATAIAALEAHPMPPRFDAQSGLFEVLGDLMPGPRAMAMKRPDLFGAVIERRMSAQPTTNALIRTTGAVTIVSGGVKPNVLPQEAEAIVNFRIMPGDSIEAVIEHVRETVGPGVEVTVEDSGFAADPPSLADRESPQFALIAELAREHCSVEAAAPWILTGATDSRHFIPLADQVLRFVPLTATADDFKRFHGTGERIRRADADSAVSFYRSLIETLRDLSVEVPAEPSPRTGLRPITLIVGLSLAPLVLGFLGDLWWALDLLANFRPQVGFMLLAGAAVIWWFDRVGAQVMLFGALVALASVLPFYLGASATPQSDTIEIVTFNVGISNPRREEVASFLAGEVPDLVFLFESSFEWKHAMRRAGLPLTLVSVVPRGRIAGVTILASNALRPTAIEVDVGGEAAAVSVLIGDVVVDVIGVHPPSPTTADRSAARDRMLAATGAWAAGRDNPVVVVGDFNATPWSSAYRTLRWHGGLVDSLVGSGVQASWPDGWGPLSIPIDHVLHTPDLASAFRRTGPSFGSAHRPVLVTIGPTA